MYVLDYANLFQNDRKPKFPTQDMDFPLHFQNLSDKRPMIWRPKTFTCLDDTFFTFIYLPHKNQNIVTIV